MRTAVRAIVCKDDHLLVMRRNKFGHEYYTLVGGGVQMGETEQNALVREVGEETCLQIANPRLVFIEEAGPPYGTQLIYVCQYVAGEVCLAPHSAEAEINKLGTNLHTPMWLPLAHLPETTFRTPRLKEAILEGLKNGFPETPKTL